MKKIVFVNSRLSNGGSERVMTLIANQLSLNDDYEIHMLLIREKIQDVYKINPKIKLTQFEYNTKNKFIILIKRIIKLKSYFKKEKPDYIVSFMIDINLLTLFAGRKQLKKIIVSERADPQSNTRSRFVKKLEKMMYPKCYKVVLQTNQVKEYYDSINVNNTIVIPNPINKDILEPYDGKRERKIIAAGRFTEQKNFELLIDSFKIVYEKYPQYFLEICGEGPLEGKLRTKVMELGLEKKVFFPGFVDNINERMRKATIFVSTSNFEGISNSMIEAMAMGVPTICTDCPVGGAKMMIKNNINGILIPINDKEKLIDAMFRIIEDTEFAKKISKESVKIKNTYSIDKIVNEWEKLFIEGNDENI